jgi:hypothetical protein
LFSLCSRGMGEAMTAKTYIEALSTAQKGGLGIVVEVVSPISQMKASAKKSGVQLFSHSFTRIQARVPYDSIKAVRDAIANGEREAPHTPASVDSIDRVENGVVVYNPKPHLASKGQLIGYRPIDRLSGRLIDGEGNEVSRDDAREFVQPAFFKAKPTPAELVEKGQGPWRTVYLDNVKSAI